MYVSSRHQGVLVATRNGVPWSCRIWRVPYFFATKNTRKIGNGNVGYSLVGVFSILDCPLDDALSLGLAFFRLLMNDHNFI
jgi:hypothetical protein